MNEGHAAFAVLARAQSFAEKNKVPFRVALRATRAGNVFTTHTPVEAAFDRFEPGLVTKAAEPFLRETGLVQRGLSRPRTPRPGGFQRAVQHGLPGDARKLPRQRRGPLAREGEPATVPSALSRLARRGNPRQHRHQRRTHSHLAFRAGQPALERRPTAGTGHGWATWGRRPRGSNRSPTSTCGTIVPKPGKTLVEYVRLRLQRQLRQRNAAGVSHPEGATRPRPQSHYPRLCPAIRRVQASEPVVGRPGTVQPDSPQRRSARCRSSSPESPTRTTTAARPWCNGWCNSRGATTSATTWSSWRTTTWCWPSILPRALTCGSTTPAGRPRPAAPAA